MKEEADLGHVANQLAKDLKRNISFKLVTIFQRMRSKLNQTVWKFILMKFFHLFSTNIVKPKSQLKMLIHFLLVCTILWTLLLSTGESD